jgi:hypothetical protein
MRHYVPWILFFAAVLAVVQPQRAHAIAACYSNHGFAPGPGAVLPPRARVVYFDDSGGDTAFTATIGGKSVPVTVTALTTGSATRIFVIQIDSDRTGRLVISDGQSRTKFAVRKRVAMPRRLPVKLERYYVNMRHSTVKEVYDGLTLRLPAKTLAISAHVRLRRDTAADWLELEVPVAVVDRQSVIRLGELGCSRNYSVGLLESGVDIEVTVTLVNGTTLPLADLPAHVVAPPRP